MNIRTILTVEEINMDFYDDDSYDRNLEFLHKKSKKIEEFDTKLSELIDDMIETLHSNKYAVGLAAPQIGILKQVAVIDIGQGVIELINPFVVEATGEQEDIEGCLSFPNKYGLVKRPDFVKVRSFDRKGREVFFEGKDLLARAFCHEIDHLNGIVFLKYIKKGGILLSKDFKDKT